MTAAKNKYGEKIKSDLERLNDLIDWYEKFKPEAGREIQLAVGPLGMAKIFKLKKDERYVPTSWVWHRGRKIVATKAVD